MEFAAQPVIKPKFISPTKILEDLGLREGCSVVDFASGAGHWSIAAAQLVGASGKVLALEDDVEMLALVVNQATTRGITNIEIEEINLAKAASKKAKKEDLVIVSNIMHLISDKDSVARNLSEMVGEQGKLLFIDWLPRATLLGPPLRLRLTEERVIQLFESAGLKLACTVDTGWQHFGLVFDRIGDGCGWRDQR